MGRAAVRDAVTAASSRRGTPLVVSLLAATLLASSADAGSEDETAEALWTRGERERAIAAWIDELAERPDDTTTRMHLVEAELEVHRYEDALAHMEPLGADVDALRGRALYLLTRYEEAVDHLAPVDDEQAIMLVDALLALGRTEEADRALAQALAELERPDPRLHVLEARRLTRTGALDAAIAAFDAVLAEHPTEPAALYGLGRALLRAGRREAGLDVMRRHRELQPRIDAYEAARQGLDLDPLSAAGHAQLGDALRGLGHLDAASDSYERAATLAADDEHVPIALRHARLLEEDLGRLDAAVALLDAAYARTADPRAAVRAGDLLMRADRPAEALQRYEHVLAARPDDAAVRARADAARERR